MFDSVRYMVSATTVKGNYYQTGEPIRFTYGRTSTYSSSDSYSVNYVFMSQSLVVPLLKGLGPDANIDIIVPFQSGSTYQLSGYEPLLYYGLRYSYFK